MELEGKLKPLIARLDAVNANYQQFYSSLPIISIGGTPVLKATQAAQPILWLTTELKQLHRFKSPLMLSSGLKQILANTTQKASASERKLGVSAWLRIGVIWP